MSDDGVKLRRILLPLDVSRDSLSALKIAFDLAAALGAEVAGLFIEDVELLAAAGLPFAREVGSYSGIRKRIVSADVEHGFRAIAGKARDALAEAGQRLKVRSSFRVTRGGVLDEILSATGGADLVVLGKAGWSVGTFRKPGSTCLAILSQSNTPVLIAEHGVTLSAPIVVVHDETAAGRRALDFARELSRILGWELTVLAVRGISRGDEVLQRMHEDKPRLIVLPSSLPLEGGPCRLKWPVLFVP